MITGYKTQIRKENTLVICSQNKKDEDLRLHISQNINITEITLVTHIVQYPFSLPCITNM